MNLAIRGIDAQIAHGDSFHNDQHPDLKTDYVLAKPPMWASTYDWYAKCWIDAFFVPGTPTGSQSRTEEAFIALRLATTGTTPLDR